MTVSGIIRLPGTVSDESAPYVQCATPGCNSHFCYKCGKQIAKSPIQMVVSSNTIATSDLFVPNTKRLINVGWMGLVYISYSIVGLT
ncbi:hypothetical protein PISMIDRAFT_681582 [Pisolithus microcarpus 441]|uniref:Uncharacterized protein n=1 Tax=Pisolithus microcarpus 441 TaxID=765257 RepID=A0A0C9ZN05_9AGAM|nr:hypothetical protein PISMIDRAFT_681582 [Pisolithus microcarpus 441]